MTHPLIELHQRTKTFKSDENTINQKSPEQKNKPYIRYQNIYIFVHPKFKNSIINNKHIQMDPLINASKNDHLSKVMTTH